MWASAAVLALAAFMLLPAGEDSNKAQRLAEAERQLDFCRSVSASCAASEKTVDQRRAELMGGRPDPFVAYSLGGSAPFFFLIGVVLFAAGKVEEAVLGSGGSSTEEAGSPLPPTTGSLHMAAEEAAEWTKKHKT